MQNILKFPFLLLKNIVLPLQRMYNYETQSSKQIDHGGLHLWTLESVYQNDDSYHI